MLYVNGCSPTLKRNVYPALDLRTAAVGKKKQQRKKGCDGGKDCFLEHVNVSHVSYSVATYQI